MMLNKTIKLILISLLIFTPIAFGSMEIWAFSLMELGILLLVVLWAIQNVMRKMPACRLGRERGVRNFKYEILFITVFLALILLQIMPIPSWAMKILSPKAYEIRHALASAIPQSAIGNPQFQISFVPFVTKIEFLKWLTLSGLFFFLLYSGSLEEGIGRIEPFIIAIFLMGIFQSLYGIFEFFNGHQQILHLRGVPFVTGTFTNRNYFAGYLLVVIPMSMGFLFYNESIRKGRFKSLRQRFSALDGKTLLIGFGIIVMILGLLFSASRTGIVSLLLSFSLISALFSSPQRGKRFSRTSLLILGLALVWGAWIGLDAVISRFFSVPEDLRSRAIIWADSFKIVKDFPLLGSGLGTFSQIFPMYQSFHIRRFVSHAENDFLQLASEVGLVGIGVLFVLFIFLFFKAISSIRSLSNSEPQRYIGLGGLVGILALMFHSLVERNLQVPANAFLFTFILAMVLRLKGREIHQTHHGHRGEAK